MAVALTWCFTDNTPVQDETGDYLIPVDPSDFAYLLLQLEEAPTTGTLHWQGYVKLHKKSRLSGVRKLFPHGVHLEPARGSPASNIAYCTKEEGRVQGPYEFGTRPSPGKRTDINALREAVRSGKRFRQLVEDDTLLPTLARHLKFYDRVSLAYEPPFNPSRRVVLYYGKPGVGKTRAVYDACRGSDLYVTPVTNGTLWFDGYEGHRNVLIDDFDGAASKVPLDTTLRILDIYNVKVPIKGSHAWFNPDVTYITTNSKPSDWYNFSGREDKYDALLRRIHIVYAWDDETESFKSFTTPEAIKAFFPYSPRAIDETRIYK